MQNGDASDAVVATPTEPAKPEEITKRSIRQQVWKHLESNRLASFPRPVYQRIPNFKGAAEAVALLAETEAFKRSNTVFVNPDKPREIIRIKCIESKKVLYVPGTEPDSGYVTRIEPPAEEDLKKVVSRNGMKIYGKNIGLDESVTLDMIVIGSVAVSKQGYHIGNGRGYSDLEFGVLAHMKSITPATVVVTVVHDCQVFDTLPAELFGPHDVPVDIIVTNTQVIETQRMSQRPTGILWHLLSKRRVESMPLLGKLREIEMQAGKPCPLKEVDTDPEERAAPRIRRNFRQRRSVRRRSENNKEGAEEGEPQEGGKSRRPSNRRNSQKSVKEGGDNVKRRVKKHRVIDIDFSLKLSNITPNTRVRDLKMALTERGIKPGLMVWKGFRGYCYLHFLKSHKKEEPKGEGDIPEASPPTMESVIAALRDMQVREGGGDAQSGQEHPEPAGAPYTVLVEPAPPRKLPEPAKLADEPVVTSEQATAV